MFYKNKGFTLIELMITVVIIGILSMFALIAYQDFTKRTYVAEGMQLAAPHKTAVAEFYSVEGSTSANTSHTIVPPEAEHAIDYNAILGLGKPSSYKAGAVKQIFVGPSSYIVIQFNEKVIDNGSVILMPAFNDGTIQWTCMANLDGTDEDITFVSIPNKYLPVECLP